MMHIRQSDPNGCALACVAMILGMTYAEARAHYGDPQAGKSYYWWMDVLGCAGFSYQHFFKYSPHTNAPREDWPLKPWAPAHICNVDAGRGSGTHVCVMLADGTVFDPAFDAPRRLSDYPDVTYIAGIWPAVSAKP